MNIDSAVAAQFLKELNGVRRVLIGTHLNPDGDALGSAIAISLYLDLLGVENEVVCHHGPPANMLFLPHVQRVRQTPANPAFDLGIIVDLESLHRLGSCAPLFEPLSRLIVIDHHQPHHELGDLRIVDVDASATAILIANLIQSCGGPITPDIATCLLTGIVTDTGSFRFRNTNPEALHVAARLIECGGDITRVSEEVFHRKPLSSARLMGLMLERMKLECDERLCWSTLDFQDFQSARARDEDTEGFVNELLSIQTVQIAALYREARAGRVRVSLRSRGDYDVAEVAREFDGGGHRNAAGCSFDGSIASAVARLTPRLRACLESS